MRWGMRRYAIQDRGKILRTWKATCDTLAQDNETCNKHLARTITHSQDRNQNIHFGAKRM